MALFSLPHRVYACVRVAKARGKYTTNQRNHRLRAATETSPSRSAGCLGVRSIDDQGTRLTESSRAWQLAPHVWVIEVGTRRPGASKEQRPGARSPLLLARAAPGPASHLASTDTSSFLSLTVRSRSHVDHASQ